MNRRDFLKTTLAGSAAVIAGAGFISLPTQAKPVSLSTKIGIDVGSKESIKKFENIISAVKKNNWETMDIGQLTGAIGKMFTGTPYVGGTLDTVGPERCIVDLAGLDCVTLFENSLDIARIIKKGKYSFNDLQTEIKYTRYRNGKLQDYTSRLHYTADWFFDNEKKGVVDDISKELGGRKFPNKVFFMSKNYKYYRALKENNSLIQAIEEYENKINERTYYYIPSDKIKKIENKLNTGDIIAFATSKKGLDYAHTGLVYVDENKKARLLHASSVDKVVKLDSPISEYISKIDTNIGISIARPLPVA